MGKAEMVLIEALYLTEEVREVPEEKEEPVVQGELGANMEIEDYLTLFKIITQNATYHRLVIYMVNLATSVMAETVVEAGTEALVVEAEMPELVQVKASEETEVKAETVITAELVERVRKEVLPVRVELVGLAEAAEPEAAVVQIHMEAQEAMAHITAVLVVVDRV